jgi:hypothetical protein
VNSEPASVRQFIAFCRTVLPSMHSRFSAFPDHLRYSFMFTIADKLTLPRVRRIGISRSKIARLLCCIDSWVDRSASGSNSTLDCIRATARIPGSRIRSRIENVDSHF